MAISKLESLNLRTQTRKMKLFCRRRTSYARGSLNALSMSSGKLANPAFSAIRKPPVAACEILLIQPKKLIINFFSQLNRLERFFYFCYNGIKRVAVITGKIRIWLSRKNMSAIKQIQAREILDSRGNPTVEVTVNLKSGAKGTAAVPSGASTGAFEAAELRDNDPIRYGGLGVLRALENVNNEITASLVGMEALEQEKIDKKMIVLDGTENKSRLGANAILGVSLAVARAAAAEKKLELYAYLVEAFKFKKSKNLPTPMFNILNGGKHSDSGLSFQEFMVVPSGIKSFSEQVRAGSEIFHALKKLLEKNNYSVAVGDEGGFAPRLSSHAQALELIAEAVSASGYCLGEQINIGLDVAANSFYEEKEDKYLLKPEGVSLSRESLINLYREYSDKNFVVFIEDGLGENDWIGWKIMSKKIGAGSNGRNKKHSCLVIGDDLLVTNIKRLKKAIIEQSCNGAIVKLNQIGTLSETINFIKLAKRGGIKIVVSHRSGETSDDFIADLAFAAGADFIKSGAPSRGERVGKYNRLMKIEINTQTNKK